MIDEETPVGRPSGDASSALLRCQIALLEGIHWPGCLAVLVALASCMMGESESGAASMLFLPAFLSALYALWLVWRLRFDRAVLALFLSEEINTGKFDDFLRSTFKKRPAAKDMAARIQGVNKLLMRLALTLALSCSWIAGAWLYKAFQP